MKHIKNILGTMLLTAAAVVATSCVDDTKLLFDVEKPASIAGMEYLNQYDALKTYINSSANPDFKLGIALAASDYIAGGQVTRLANSNFHEMTAGNAMKYASCVSDDGTMNFGTVENFVSAAKAGGITIYGHTLAWHAQQNNKYLNSLLKDKEMDGDPDEKIDVEDYVVDYSKDPYTFWKQAPEGVTIDVNTSEGCLEVINPTPAEQNYLVQYHTADGLPTLVGKEYKLKMMIKGSGKGRLSVGVGPWSGRAEGGFDFDTEWKEYEFAFKAVADGGHVMTQSGLFAGTIQIKYVKITHSESPAVEVEQEKVMRTYQDGPFPFYVMGCEPPVIDGCIHFVPTGDWSQFFILPGGENSLEEGNYVMYLDLKSSKDGDGVQLTMQNGWGGDAQSITVSVPIKAGSQMVRLNLPNVAGGNYDVILKPQTCDATLDLKSVRICKVVKMNSIPLTPEEKKDTLTWAMNNWVEGMMKATTGYVTAWDVVNEAISGGGDDGEGFYPLQSSASASAEDAKNNFYWQDYLGSVDYVRITVAAARKYYAENDGINPLKLFVNDYNLESDWDDNKKVKSLVHWIKKWEADGVTKIDGIGTQMHVSCYANAAIQKSKEDHIVKMFEIMAKSGKLVKISELDMGYIDENGNSVKTENMTEVQHKAMSEYYNFIVKKFFEIIPAAQQYGITQWCATDSPNSSSWRGGEPVGLWDANYNRKHVYAGFAEGLSGK
ncbi:endo-1,4-beta-xylanase [Bacteroides oleiciplenus]|uniref:endo-1,4-beta-xylanase n=1 Tax=Bacteroides oleiciplenus TaxID=626931 RepID=UPI0026DB7EBE|nr:endo-1,4-beta-xylanase [Bacteroides oleiciplenus]